MLLTEDAGKSALLPRRIYFEFADIKPIARRRATNFRETFRSAFGAVIAAEVGTAVVHLNLLRLQIINLACCQAINGRNNFQLSRFSDNF